MHKNYLTWINRNRRFGKTDHEEVDTKIAYLLQYAVKCRPEEQQIIFIVRSISGDIDNL